MGVRLEALVLMDDPFAGFSNEEVDELFEARRSVAKRCGFNGDYSKLMVVSMVIQTIGNW